MILFTSRCSAIFATAALVIALSQHEADAFSPPNPRRRPSARVIGAGTNGKQQQLQSSTAITPPVTKSTTPTFHLANDTKTPKSPSSSENNETISSRNVKTNIIVKNVPDRNRKGGAKNKSFKALKDLRIGSTLSGVVVDVCDFGAFVNIGYATLGSRPGTALLHISQIQDTIVSNIHDVIKVGDRIEDARVVSLDLKKSAVGISLRKPRPKRVDLDTLKVGDTLEGRVDSVVPYGVFVDVGTKVNALLHISRITGGAIENVRQHLNEGDSVKVRIIDLDKQKKTLAVSMLDKKADQYLDRRMSQRLKRFYGTASSSERVVNEGVKGDESNELDYFDQAIRELEEALRGRSS